LVTVHHFNTPLKWEQDQTVALTKATFDQRWFEHCIGPIAAIIRIEYDKIQTQTINPFLAQQSIHTLMTRSPLNVLWAQMIAFRMHKRSGLTKAARVMMDQIYANNLQLLFAHQELPRVSEEKAPTGWAQFWRPIGVIPMMSDHLIKHTLFQFTTLLTVQLLDEKDPQSLVSVDFPASLTFANFHREWMYHCTGSVAAGIITFRQRIEQIMQQLTGHAARRAPPVWYLIAGPEHIKFAQGVTLMFQLPMAKHSRRQIQEMLNEHDYLMIFLARAYIQR
jgi:hypothetical protein